MLRPDLQGPNLPQQHFPEAQLATPGAQFAGARFAAKIHKGPDLSGPNLPRTEWTKQASDETVNVRRSHLKKSYLVGFPESISHQEVPPQLLCIICTVFALLDSFEVTSLWLWGGNGWLRMVIASY